MTNAILILKQSLAIGVAGFFGALSRVLVGKAVDKLILTSFPLGTLIVNVSGCFILGAFYMYAKGGGERAEFGETIRLAIGVGFVGAYTTFSTLMYDSDALWTHGHTTKAAANLILSLILGIVAVRLGIAFGRRP